MSQYFSRPSTADYDPAVSDKGHVAPQNAKKPLTFSGFHQAGELPPQPPTVTTSTHSNAGDFLPAVSPLFPPMYPPYIPPPPRGRWVWIPDPEPVPSWIPSTPIWCEARATLVS